MSGPILNILYADDDIADAELLLMSFERYLPEVDIKLDICSSIADAKARIDFETHTAALIDWNLTDGLGTDLAAFIRASHRDFPILFLSNVFTADRLEMAKSFAPSASLEKSYSKDHLSKMISLLGDMMQVSQS